MPKIRFIRYLFLLCFLIPTIASAEPQESKDYSIIKGDTLWDISGKELHDPFLWPKIWKENPEIKNPDRVYPGQSIRIPLYVLEKEKSEELPAPVADSKPLEVPIVTPVIQTVESALEMPTPLVGRSLFMSSGYIAETVGAVGKVGGSPYKGLLFGNNDTIYVSTDKPVNVGDKFYVVRLAEYVRHPATDKRLGYIVAFRGVAEISKLEFGETLALITQVFDDIVTGDLLIPFYPLSPPVVAKPYRTPHIDGTVVGTRNFRAMSTARDVVYIDKGRKDGIQIGDIFRVLAHGEHTFSTGTVQIIHARETTSTATVLNSTDPILRGQTTTFAE